jgi:hypothetical protein
VDAATPLTTVVLAHQGGWDEILLVAVPLVVMAGLLALANRRANAALKARADEPEPNPSNPDR